MLLPELCRPSPAAKGPIMIRALPLLVLLLPAAARAQTGAAIPPAAEQIAIATAPLPAEFRDAASVLGYAAGHAGLVQLRSAPGPFICLADDPREERFHVACYHRSLGPFMARGRALRAEGRGQEVEAIRTAEIAAGTLRMPEEPAALYSLTGPAASVKVDAATGTVSGARPLYVIYIPFATPESTGIPAKAAPNSPWLMFPGTAGAHIMFVPQM